MAWGDYDTGAEILSAALVAHEVYRIAYILVLSFRVILSLFSFLFPCFLLPAFSFFLKKIFSRLLSTVIMSILRLVLCTHLCFQCITATTFASLLRVLIRLVLLRSTPMVATRSCHHSHVVHLSWRLILGFHRVSR